MTINQQVAQERQNRLASFPELSNDEISRRQAIDLDWQSVLEVMVTNFKAANLNLDFRYYKSVILGNTILSAIPNQKKVLGKKINCFKFMLEDSKYNQELFALFNFGESFLSLRVGDQQKPLLPKIQEFDQPMNLIGREVIINCTGVGFIGGNMKISPKHMPVSMIFDEVGSVLLDIREAASYGEVAEYIKSTLGDDSLTGNWNIKLFSMQDASIAPRSTDPRASYFTTGNIDFVYNENTKVVDLAEYLDISGNPLYYDTDGKKLG
jgi:hypothetical protein